MSKAEEYAKVAEEAHQAGIQAGSNHAPEPMVISYSGKTETISTGVCGFAWVLVFPASQGFGRWATKMRIGTKAYGGGMQIWVSYYGQSMEMKLEYAKAYSAVLNKYGIQAYAESRMD